LGVETNTERVVTSTSRWC